MTDNHEIPLQFDIAGIQECQCNRYPMLFIDRITECVPFKYAKGYKLFSYNEWYFPGHFAENPNVPGAVLIESLTQVFLMTFLSTGEAKASAAVSNSFKNIIFYRKVLPGDKLEIEAICKSFRRGVAQGNVIGRIRGESAVQFDCTIVVPKLFGQFQKAVNESVINLESAEVVPDAGLCLDINEIQKCMKNRHPWLYIDRMTEVIPGKSAVGVKNFTFNEWFFPSHFPGDPNVPGFIQIEACLQAFIMTMLSLEEYKGLETADRAIDNMKLLRKIVPGDCLKIVTKLDSFNRGIAKGRVESFVNGQPACSFDATAVVLEILAKFTPKAVGAKCE